MSSTIKRALHAKELPPNPTIGEVFHAPKDCYVMATRSIDITLNTTRVGHIATMSTRPQGYYLFHCMIAREVTPKATFTLQTSDLYYTSVIWTPDQFWAGTGAPVRTTTQEMVVDVEYVSDVQRVGTAYCYREMHVKERKGTK